MPAILRGAAFQFTNTSFSTSASDNNNTSGKTVFAGSLAGACVLLIAGQSNVSGVAPTPYTPTNPVYNLNIYDGIVYLAADPLLGGNVSANPGSFAGRLADDIINASLFTKVVLIPVGVDATAISSWIPPTPNYGDRISAAIAWCNILHLPITAIIWGQGEQDNLNSTSQVNYTSRLNTLITATRNIGYNGPWFIAEETYYQGVTWAPVQSAQLGIANPSANIFAGAVGDTLGAGYRSGDNIHFDDTGMPVWASRWLSALQASGPPF